MFQWESIEIAERGFEMSDRVSGIGQRSQYLENLAGELNGTRSPDSAGQNAVEASRQIQQEGPVGNILNAGRDISTVSQEARDEMKQK